MCSLNLFGFGISTSTTFWSFHCASPTNSVFPSCCQTLIASLLKPTCAPLSQRTAFNHGVTSYVLYTFTFRTFFPNGRLLAIQTCRRRDLYYILIGHSALYILVCKGSVPWTWRLSVASPYLGQDGAEWARLHIYEVTYAAAAFPMWLGDRPTLSMYAHILLCTTFRSVASCSSPLGPARPGRWLVVLCCVDLTHFQW